MCPRSTASAATWPGNKLAEYTAGLERAISFGWLEIHDSGTFVKLTKSGADLFA
jgi:hypothetical protein